MPDWLFTEKLVLLPDFFVSMQDVHQLKCFGDTILLHIYISLCSLCENGTGAGAG